MEIINRAVHWLRRRGRGAQPFTVVEGPGGEKTMVDAAMLAYLKSTAPEPSQSSLDVVLDRVRALRVFNGGCDGDRLLRRDMLVEVDDPAQIAALRATLRIVDGPGGHCMLPKIPRCR
jgi:hypothetical protein